MAKPCVPHGGLFSSVWCRLTTVSLNLQAFCSPKNTVTSSFSVPWLPFNASTPAFAGAGCVGGCPYDLPGDILLAASTPKASMVVPNLIRDRPFHREPIEQLGDRRDRV